MDYPSNPDVGLIDGKFNDELIDPTEQPSVIPAEWANLLTDSMLKVLEAGGVNPSDTDPERLVAAIQALVNPARFTTGDVKAGIWLDPGPGWVLMNDGTIGSGGSGANTRANDDCEALFKLLWNRCTNTFAPVTGGRGSSADDDWDAGKSIKLLSSLGRVFANAGGDPVKAMGLGFGASTMTLQERHMPPHDHLLPEVENGDGGGLSVYDIRPNSYGAKNRKTDKTGDGDAFSLHQPTMWLNYALKL